MSKSSNAAGYHHGNLREELVLSARSILDAEGMEKLSLRAVARKAGVSQTAPYRHFRDKPELLAAVAAMGFRELKAAMLDAVSISKPKGPAQELLACGRGYVNFALTEVDVYRLIFGADVWQADQNEDLKIAANEAYGIMESAVVGNLGDQSKEASIVSASALSVWSTVHGLAHLLIDGQMKERASDKKSLEGVIDAVLLRAIKGIRPAGQKIESVRRKKKGKSQ